MWPSENFCKVALRYVNTYLREVQFDKAGLFSCIFSIFRLLSNVYLFSNEKNILSSKPLINGGKTISQLCFPPFSNSLMQFAETHKKY